VTDNLQSVKSTKVELGCYTIIIFTIPCYNPGFSITLLRLTKSSIVALCTIAAKTGRPSYLGRSKSDKRSHMVTHQCR